MAANVCAFILVLGVNKNTLIQILDYSFTTIAYMQCALFMEYTLILILTVVAICTGCAS
jgi:hypothetical protein